MNGIRVLHVEDAGFYEISLPHGRWLINESIEHTVETYAGITVTITSPVSSIHNITQVNDWETVTYLDTILTRDEWEKRLHALLSDATKDDEGEWYFGGNIESEFEYKKFVRDSKKNYFLREVKTPREFFVVKTAMKSPTPWAKSLYHLDGDPCMCILNVGGIQLDELKAYTEKYDLEFTNSSHSHIRFAQIEGKYVFPDRGFDNPNATLKVPIAEAVEAEHKVRESVRYYLRLIHKTLTALPDTTLKDIHRYLVTIRASNNEIRGGSRKKLEHCGTINSAINQIEKLLQEAAQE